MRELILAPIDLCGVLREEEDNDFSLPRLSHENNASFGRENDESQCLIID